MWIITPKDKFRDLVEQSDNEDLVLLLDAYTIVRGDYFGHHYTGEALINCSLEFKRSMELAQEEWSKIAYLSSLENEYTPEFFESISSTIGKFQLSASFFDKYWNILYSEDTVDVNKMVNLPDSIKEKILISQNDLLIEWLSKVKDAT